MAKQADYGWVLGQDPKKMEPRTPQQPRGNPKMRWWIHGSYPSNSCSCSYFLQAMEVNPTMLWESLEELTNYRRQQNKQPSGSILMPGAQNEKMRIGPSQLIFKSVRWWSCSPKMKLKKNNNNSTHLQVPVINCPPFLNLWFLFFMLGQFKL